MSPCSTMFARFLVVVLVACGGPSVRRRGAPATEASATAAYDGKAWGVCAQQWLEIADHVHGRKHRDALYWAACCYALDGNPDAAFLTLDAAIASGFLNIRHIESDPDLIALHADPRWSQQLAKAEASLGAPQLRRQLIELEREDQEARKAWEASFDAKQPPAEVARLFTNVIAIDQRSTRALKVAIAKYGWPGKRLVGDDGAGAAALLAQHADRDHAFQVDVLARMKVMLESGDVEARHYAYLYDRVAVAEGRPQRYGTQLRGDKPFPIEDEANVDARRASVGLGPLAEYVASFRKQP